MMLSASVTRYRQAPALIVALGLAPLGDADPDGLPSVVQTDRGGDRCDHGGQVGDIASDRDESRGRWRYSVEYQDDHLPSL